MGELSTREIAIALWLGIALIYGICQERPRRALHELIKAFFHRKIVAILLLMYSYIALVVVLLDRLELWQIDQLKNTLIWSATVGFASFLEIRSIEEDDAFLRKMVLENLKLLVVIEYVVSTYTFNLLVEFLLVPATVFLGFVIALTEDGKEMRALQRIANAIMALIGGSAIAYAVLKIVTGFSAFATLDTARDFYTPPLLTLLFLPFLYVLRLFVVYETVFGRLRWAIEHEGVRTYAKCRAALAFRTDREFLKRWSRSVSLLRPVDREVVVSSIAKIKEIKRREQAPPAISWSEGWSPYVAMELLTDQGLMAGDYHWSYGDDWFASTPYLEFGEGMFKNNLAYYVEGGECVAVALRLVLNVNEPEQSLAAEKHFWEVGLQMLRRAFRVITEDSICHLANVVLVSPYVLDGRKVSLLREDWNGRIKGGYTMKLMIEVQASEGLDV